MAYWEGRRSEREVLTMREILFRGKRLKDGAWIEGFYCEFANNMSGEQEHFIQTVKADGRIDTLYHVDPSTVGQYTGLTDKNGKRIFEGDICLCDRNIAPSVDEQTFQILFDVEAGQWVGSGPNSDIDPSQFCMCEVVKTVHDNPELLEGGQSR